MSMESVWRLLCDAPHCPATAMVDVLSDAPDGWTVLRSADYTKGKPAPLIGRGRNRRPVSGWDLGNGSFTLHLCPDHTDAFGELPTTLRALSGRGLIYGERQDDGTVLVRANDAGRAALAEVRSRG